MKRQIHYRVPAYEKREVPDGALEFAERRTEFLHGLLVIREPLSYVLACAYLQGVEDAAQAIANHGLPSPELDSASTPPSKKGGAKK